MAEQLTGEVVHVVSPEELDDYDLEADVRRLAESRYLLVCRKGGVPSWPERIRAFLTRQPVEAVTLVSETAAEEGEEVTATVVETDVSGVYEATALE